MGTITENLELIRGTVDEDTLAKIKPYLNDINTAQKQLALTLDDLTVEKNLVAKSLKDRNQENQERRLKFDEISEELDKLKTAQTEFETTNQDLLNYKKTHLAQDRKSFIDSFSKISAHAKFEKAKDRFVLPEKDKAEKYLWDKLEDSDLEKNINTLQDLNSLEYFDTETKPVNKKVFGDRFVNQSTEKEKMTIEERLANAAERVNQNRS